MKLIEIEAKLARGGIIQIPKEELDATGLREGDDICLLYLSESENDTVNSSGEFILEKRVE